MAHAIRPPDTSAPARTGPSNRRLKTSTPPGNEACRCGFSSHRVLVMGGTTVAPAPQRDAWSIVSAQHPLSLREYIR